MYSAIFILSLFAIGCTYGALSTTSPNVPAGDVRNCPTMQTINPNKPLLRMDALPGLGFDNLRNIDLGQVYSWNYTQCQVSNDGVYLLPDNIYLVPVLNSEVDFFANVYDHYDHWKSTTSYSINTELKISWAHINGKFSAEYEDTKTKMVNSNSRSVRVGLKHHLYTVHINPDGQLHRSFKSRLMDLASNIQSNNTEMANYLADLIIRDYGTHFVTSIEAGAGLYQTTFVSRDYMENSEESRLTISASASAHFLSIFNLDISVKVTTTNSDVNGFNDFTRHLRTSTHGGPPFKLSNFSYADWENGLLDNLIAIDRRGEPLFTAITTTNFPELPTVLLLESAEYVYKAIVRYYKINSHKGCTDFGSGNFDFRANVDDNSCTKNRQNHTFGGVYQSCVNHDGYDTCGYYDATQTNPLTSDYSCPSGYRAMFLHSGTLSRNVPVTKYKEHCGWWSCHPNSYQVSYIRYATYSAYWCYYPPGQTVPADSGYMFGGVYSSKHPNAVTGTSSCPPFFHPLHFGQDIQVCVSNDIEGLTYSLPFGGFHSCSYGNPLSVSTKQFQKGLTSFPLQCPQLFSQFLVTVDQGCIVNYCSKVNDLLKYSSQPPIIPPYKIRAPMTVNQSDSLAIMGPYGTVWVKGDDGMWSKYEAGEKINGYEYVQSFLGDSAVVINDTSTQLMATETPFIQGIGSTRGPRYDGTQVAGIVVGTVFATALCIAFIAFASCGVSKYHRRRKAKKESLLYLDSTIPRVSVSNGENETTVLVQKIE